MVVEEEKLKESNDVTINEYPVTNVRIGELVFDPTNPNKTSEKTMEGERNSILEFGFVQPIVINEHNEIADGEHRAIIMRALGRKEIPAIIVPKLNDDLQRRLARQALNKLRGSHDLKLDIDELTMLLEKQGNKLLTIMNINRGHVDQLTHMYEMQSLNVQSAINNEEGGLREIGDPLPTSNRCPQCGFEW